MSGPHPGEPGPDGADRDGADPFAQDPRPPDARDLRARRQAIVELALQAVVRVQHPRLRWPDTEENSRHVWGTGFFVAPGWVITDAHVLWPRRGSGERGDGEVGLAMSDGRLLRGRWAAALPGRRVAPRHSAGLTPWPDLALIQVVDPPEHPCVWLDESRPPLATEVAVAGYAVRYDGFYEEWSDTCRVTGHSGTRNRPRLLIRGADIPFGSSGGPMVDLDEGWVCGVLTARSGERLPSGAASPIRGLRELVDALGPVRHGVDDGPRFELAPGLALGAGELFQEIWRGHDRYHARQLGRVSGGSGRAVRGGGPSGSARDPGGRDPGGRSRRSARAGQESWIHGAAALRAGTTRPNLVWLTRLRALLAELPPPPPGVPLGMVERLVELAPSPEVPPWLWRDGLDNLVALAPPALAEAAERFCEQAADWARLVAPRPGRLVLRVERAFYDRGAYYWRIDRLQGPDLVVPCAIGDRPVPAGELLGRVRSSLTRALQDADQGHETVVVEAVLPRELFELAVDELLLDGQRPARLGVAQVLVLRDAERVGEPSAEDLRRWDALETGPLRPQWVSTQAAADAVGLRKLLRAGERTVPFWHGSARTPAGAAVLDEALDAGHRVLLWSRDSAAGPDQVAEFARTLPGLLLESATVDRIPGLVQELRAAVERGEMVWARGLVLLYDSPKAPYEPPAPLAGLD